MAKKPLYDTSPSGSPENRVPMRIAEDPKLLNNFKIENTLPEKGNSMGARRRKSEMTEQMKAEAKSQFNNLRDITLQNIKAKKDMSKTMQVQKDGSKGNFGERPITQVAGADGSGQMMASDNDLSVMQENA